MITQTIRVNLNQKDLETILAVQSDSLREIAFEFYATDAEEAVQLDPDDFTVKFNVLKPDNNFVMTTFTDGVIKLSDQITAVTGTGYYCILLMQDNEVIYSGNGKIIINDHVIGTENIDSVSEADGYTFPDDFYTKDTPLAVLDDSTTSTTSTWSSEKIAEEIASIPGVDIIDDTVTSTEKTWSSSKISAEVEAAAASEIDDNTTATNSTWSSAKIAEEISEATPVITKEVTGNPIEFTDGADAPLVKCTTTIQGYQEGTGTPSPDNVRPIHAYTESTISVEDENEVVQQTSTATFTQSIYQGNADFVGGSERTEKKKIIISSGIQLYGNYGVDNAPLFYWNQPLSDIAPYSETASPSQNKPICNVYEAITQSNQYNMKDFEFRTNSSLAASNRFYFRDSRFSTAEEFNAYIANNPIEIAYPLVTPTTSSITPTNLPIKSLFGYNHIESSTGEMEIEYLVDDYQPIIDCIPSGPTYSTNEQITGTWTDGRPVYTRIIPVNATWQNIGTTSRQSFVYMQDFAKQIDIITDLFIIGKDQYYGYTFNAAANLDRGNGSIEACWNDPFGGLLTSVPVECVRMSYVKTASVSRNLQRTLEDIVASKIEPEDIIKGVSGDDTSMQDAVKEVMDNLQEEREEDITDEVHDQEMSEPGTYDTYRE